VLAYVDGQLAGQILVHEHWNRFAIIWDIAVDPPFRRRHRPPVDRAAVAWARDPRLPASCSRRRARAMSACGCIASCGFVLARVRCLPLYRGVHARDAGDRPFWYLLF